MGLIYCFLDIEVDGPTPGENSMLSLGFPAFDEDEREVGVFKANLETLEGACGAENVMRWWRAHPEPWAHVRRDTVPPAVGMARCLDWLEGLGPELALAAHPLLMDGIWLDWYLRRFCNAAVFRGPFRIRCPFVGAGVDVPCLCSGGFEDGVLHGSPGLSAGAAPRRAAHPQAGRRRTRARRAVFQRPAIFARWVEVAGPRS